MDYYLENVLAASELKDDFMEGMYDYLAKLAIATNLVA